MNDQEIIALYFARSEKAIAKTAEKYGKYCYTVAHHILKNHEDSEECVNDTYLKTWDRIPPERPLHFCAYLGKITRNLALGLYEKYTAEKRGGGETALVLEELAECIASDDTVEKAIAEKEMADILNRFLAELPMQTRKIFMRRYWYLSSLKEIARDFHMSEGNVRIILFRTRKKLQKILEREGFFYDK
ncbi:MAG: sigma-70 family RNA polymerase sigma factor [Clostridia bacterium]|nr:sigma-70 family RNA polymerase sigma factor [Clostridia bacterium]